MGVQDSRLASLANVIVRHCTRVRADDLVTIVGDLATLPAVEAVFEATLHAGGHPSFHAKPESLRTLLLRHGGDAQIKHVCPFEKHRLEACDVLIVLSSRAEPDGLTIDPRRAAMHQAARRELLTMSLDRLARGNVRYCLTELPSPAAARDAGMTLDEYTDWVFRAGFLHLPDPLAAWHALDEQHLRMKTHLERVITLHFNVPSHADGPHPHGATNLTVNVEGRTWLSRAGGENFPDGELDSGPRSMDGVVHFTHPAVYRNTAVEGVRLVFKDGRVTDASARTNEDFLFRMLDMDDGSRTAGEIAFGTNYHITRFTTNTFFDEKIGGTFHLALGAGYPQTGNANESGLHWDMVCDLRRGGTVTADGEVIQRDGVFVPDGWPKP